MREKIYRVTFQIESKQSIDISNIVNQILQDLKMYKMADKIEMKITKLSVEES